MTIKNWILGIAALSLIGACSGPDERTGQHVEAKPTSIALSKDSFEGVWPFTVDHGVLKCVQYNEPGMKPKALKGVIFEANGLMYAVNGTAKSRSDTHGYFPLERIWAVDTAATNGMIRVGVPPEQALLRMNIGPIIDMGLRICP